MIISFERVGCNLRRVQILMISFWSCEVKVARVWTIMGFLLRFSLNWRDRSK